jgi:hypothetical protein
MAGIGWFFDNLRERTKRAREMGTGQLSVVAISVRAGDGLTVE